MSDSPVQPTRPVRVRRIGLAQRLMLLGMLAVLLITGVGGVLMREQLHAAILRSMSGSLDERADRIVAGLAVDANGRVSFDNRLVSEEFRFIFSGWYWQLEAEGTVYRSRSLWDSSLDVAMARPVAGSVELLTLRGPRDELLYGLARNFHVAGHAYRLHVYGPAETSRKDMASIDRILMVMLGGLALAMVAGMYVQVWLGLRPLRRLHDALQRIHAGEADRAGSDYGPDLDPLAAEIDEVLERNARVVARARGNAADLSHALKKPLALLNVQSRSAEVDGTEVRRQVDTMNRMIERHLARAGSGAGDRRRIDVNECLQGLIGLMQTLHAARGIDWQLDVPGRVFWRGESTDLEEMLGNLLDNAGKWARSRVVVTVRLLTQPTTEDDGMRSRTGLLAICIEDDGAGLDDDEIARAIRRGQRFDESTEGSGLGLVIANDIAETYEGRLELGRSPLGGLHVTLRLPR